MTLYLYPRNESQGFSGVSNKEEEVFPGTVLQSQFIEEVLSSKGRSGIPICEEGDIRGAVGPLIIATEYDGVRIGEGPPGKR